MTDHDTAFQISASNVRFGAIVPSSIIPLTVPATSSGSKSAIQTNRVAPGPSGVPP